MVCLRWVLVVLCAFLPHAVMPYGIGVGCDGIDIQRLVGEAWFLMRQAAKVLDEVIENRATEVCRRAVLNILNTLVGTAAAGDPQTHIYIRNRFVEATNGIGAPGARGANIVIHCRDPEITRTYTIAGQPTTINVHPVPMARINGVPQPGSPPFLFGNSGGQLYYFVQTEPDSTIAGYTLVMEPGSDIMQGQQQHTGSSVVWSDVVLKSALAPNPTGFRSLERVTDWTPAGLMGRGLGLLDLGDLPFTTIIHELMHSTALANPIVGHGQVGGQSANGIASILQLATANDPLAASNPETFAFLAIALSMPWLRWWDSDPNNLPVFNGATFAAQFNRQPSPNGGDTACIPAFYNVPTAWDDFLPQLQKGPRAFVP